jgi:hypothetical protein
MSAISSNKGGAWRMINNGYARLADIADQGVKHTTSIGYGFGIGTLVSQAIPFIDAHSWVVGLFGIMLTWITNVFFRIIDRSNRRKRN